MSLYKRIMILAAVLLVLGGAYIFLKDRIGTTDSGTQYQSNYKKLVDIKMDDITRVIVETDEETFVIDKDKEDKNKWVLTEPADLTKYDESILKAVPLYASSLGTDRIIEEDAADLSKYGLDDPVKVTLVIADGSQTVIHIGNMIPGGESYYMRISDSMTVSKMDSFTAKKLLITRNGIRNKTLFGVTTDEVTQISMERGGSKVFESEKSGDNTWKLTYPIDGNVNSSAIYPMLDAVVNMTAVEFIDENPSDLSKYGLDKPGYVLSFNMTEKGSAKVLFGRESKKGSEIYAMIDGEDVVFTTSLSGFGFLDKPIKEIVEVFAYIVNIQDVSGIDVEMDGYKVKLDIQTDPDDKDKDMFYVDGKLATMKDEKGSQPFRKYYQALIGVTLAEVLPDAKPEGKAEITFTYYLKKDPGKMVVEFISKDDMYYYVVKNDKYSGILVKKSKFDEPEGVRETYRLLMEAISNQQ
jgi:hypothetical protein